MGANPYSKSGFNVSQLFLTYVAMAGDVDRVSVATNVEPDVIRQLATQEQWAKQVTLLNTIKEASGQRPVEIEINRRMCFIQAQRLSNLIDRVINYIGERSVGDGPDTLVEMLSVPTKNGNCFSAQALKDLVKAAEGAHALAYRALGDSPAERKPPEDNEKTAAKIGLAVRAALRAADSTGSAVAFERARLADEIGVPDANLDAKTKS